MVVTGAVPHRLEVERHGRVHRADRTWDGDRAVTVDMKGRENRGPCRIPFPTERGWEDIHVTSMKVNLGDTGVVPGKSGGRGRFPVVPVQRHGGGQMSNNVLGTDGRVGSLTPVVVQGPSP